MFLLGTQPRRCGSRSVRAFRNPDRQIVIGIMNNNVGDVNAKPDYSRSRNWCAVRRPMQQN